MGTAVRFQPARSRARSVRCVASWLLTAMIAVGAALVHRANRIVNFAAGPTQALRDRLVGQLIDVRITTAYPHSLRAELPLA